MTRFDNSSTGESEVGIIEELKEMMKDLDKRTEVERMADKLISECRFEEAIEILKTI